MPYRINWTESAKKSFDDIIEYLLHDWTQKEVNQLIYRTERVLELLSNNPRIYPVIHQDIRRCVLSKHNSLFFVIENNQVTILACWDNRKDPKELKL